MLTRRNFLATGVGAFAVTAAGGAAFAAPLQAAGLRAAPVVSIVSESLRATTVAATADHQLVLGHDRLANLRDLRAVLAEFGGNRFDLTLDAADAMLMEIAAADLDQPMPALAIRPTTSSAGV